MLEAKGPNTQSRVVKRGATFASRLQLYITMPSLEHTKLQVKGHYASNNTTYC